MIKRLDHIAIFVKDLDEAVKFFQDKYGLTCSSRETVGDEANIAFFPIGDTQLELVQPISPDGMVAKHIKEKGEGVNHIAFEVEDVKSALEKAKSEGIISINDEPRQGAHNAMIAFLDPKSNYGITIELVEHQSHE